MPDWATWCWRMRTGLRLTQKEAAEIAGCAVRTWRRWEGHDAQPAEHVKDRVRDAFTLEAVSFMGAAAASGGR